MTTSAGTDRAAYKRPVSVLVVVTTEGGEALLLRRRHPPDFWQSVTGSLEPGETPLTAATRELLEETGIDAVPVATGQVNRFPILPAWRARYHPQVRENEEHVFVVRLPGRVLVHIALEEHAEALWLGGDAAIAKASSWTDQEALKTLILSG